MRARASTLTLLCGLFVAVACGQAGAAPSWMKLDASRGSDYAWAVKVRPAGGRVSSRAPEESGPCVLVATMWRSRPLEYHRSRYRQCGSGGALSNAGPPLVATGVRPGGSRSMSVVGMIFAPGVRSVRVTLGDGRQATIDSRPVDPALQRSLGLGRFRYAAFAIRGTWCAERLVSLGATGAVLWDSGLDGYRCGAAGPPHFAPRAGA